MEMRALTARTIDVIFQFNFHSSIVSVSHLCFTNLGHEIMFLRGRVKSKILWLGSRSGSTCVRNMLASVPQRGAPDIQKLLFDPALAADD